MSHVLGSLAPLKATDRGRKAVKSEGFIRLCKDVAAAVMVSGRAYEEMETRLRTITIATLLPQRRYSADEIADYYRVNYQEVDQAWREAIAPLMKDADENLGAAIEHELGVQLPQPGNS